MIAKSFDTIEDDRKWDYAEWHRWMRYLAWRIRLEMEREGYEV